MTIKLYGLGVELTNKDSTDAVTEAPCTYINNEALVSYNYMFYKSKATSIDVSNFNSMNVKFMNQMFQESAATEIKGLNNLNTSNVLEMAAMFNLSSTTSLDLSSFDTSNVTDMHAMFYDCNNLKKYMLVINLMLLSK